MTNMTASTASEKKLVKAIQSSIGAAQDGILGPASAVDLAAANLHDILDNSRYILMHGR